MPIEPPAPPTVSTTTVWPSGARMYSAMMRAAVSVEPPGGKGTTSVTGFAGKVCANAAFTAKAKRKMRCFKAVLPDLFFWLGLLYPQVLHPVVHGTLDLLRVFADELGDLLGRDLYGFVGIVLLRLLLAHALLSPCFDQPPRCEGDGLSSPRSTFVTSSV